MVKRPVLQTHSLGYLYLLQGFHILKKMGISNNHTVLQVWPNESYVQLESIRITMLIKLMIQEANRFSGFDTQVGYVWRPSKDLNSVGHKILDARDKLKW